MVLASDGGSDGADVRFEDVLHEEPATPCLQIQLKLDVSENRIRFIGNGRGINSETGEGFLLLATENGEQGIDLIFFCSVIKD